MHDGSPVHFTRAARTVRQHLWPSLDRTRWALILEKIEDLDENSSSDSNCSPPDVLEVASEPMLNLLPPNSKEKYLQEYSLFKEWCRERNVDRVSENVVLAYFFEKSKVLKSSPSCSKFSMLKATL